MGEINPGTFDRKVNLYRQTAVRTASGEVVKNFTYANSCFAALTSKTIGEEAEAAVRLVVVQELTTHRVADIDNSWRAEIDGEMYEIVSVETIERRWTRVTVRRLTV